MNAKLSKLIRRFVRFKGGGKSEARHARRTYSREPNAVDRQRLRDFMRATIATEEAPAP